MISFLCFDWLRCWCAQYVLEQATPTQWFAVMVKAMPHVQLYSWACLVLIAC
jgi:hypothetical protein